MALGDDILTILFSYQAGYKRMRQSLYGYSSFHSKMRRSETNNAVLYLTLARLKKHGLVKKANDVWSITNEGKKYLKRRLNYILPRHQKRNVSPPERKNMIIAFDIPEKYRRKRDWLRVELIFLEFLPIQKSVWLGPAPLPKDFIENLHSLEILKYLKFFEAKEKDII